MIEVEHLRKSYGDRVAVADVSLSVDRGEIFGILGPNGAGKTTTVESIAGLRVGDAGSVRVGGLDPWTDRDGVTRLLGVQLQESRLQPRITVAEALALFASFYAEPVPWTELAERLGLTEHLDRRFDKLSGGQQQRLAIALALVGRPEVVVLDELTTGLDPRARRETWSLVREVRDSGVTVLLVTHSMEEAEELCDRVAIIAEGRVRALDNPAALAGGGSTESPDGTQVQLSFVPRGVLRPEALRDLPGLRGLRTEDETVRVHGDDRTVLAVLDRLRDLDVRPERLRVRETAQADDPRGATLDAAYLRLTGATPEEDR